MLPVNYPHYTSHIILIVISILSYFHISTLAHYQKCPINALYLTNLQLDEKFNIKEYFTGIQPNSLLKNALMKKLLSLVTVSLSLFVATAGLAADNIITGFWIKASTISQIVATNSAAAIKIYAGLTEGGEVCYLLVGADGSYRTLGTNVHQQNKKGVCPPLCDIAVTDLGEGNYMTVTKAEAGEYIDNYMTAHPGAKNCARFKMTDLAAMLASSTYVKVELGSKVTATGMKADGTKTVTNIAGTASTGGL